MIRIGLMIGVGTKQGTQEKWPEKVPVKKNIGGKFYKNTGNFAKAQRTLGVQVLDSLVLKPIFYQVFCGRVGADNAISKCTSFKIKSI